MNDLSNRAVWEERSRIAWVDVSVFCFYKRLFKDLRDVVAVPCNPKPEQPSDAADGQDLKPRKQNCRPATATVRCHF